MKGFKMKNILFMLIGVLIFTSFDLKADISPEAKKRIEKEGSKLQAAPTGFFDVRKNSVSNIEFFTSNYGIFGLDVANLVGGGYWPRNSKNQYIFGGGAWFAAQKDIPGDTIRRKYVEVSYNPNSADSWFVPGRVRDKNGNVTALADFNDIFKYRTYFSTEFNRQTGQPFASEEQDWPAWPIWDIIPEDTVKVNRYFGLYEEDENLRNIETYEKGPAFISEEDIFATFKDTDLNFYEGGFQLRRNLGYPLEIQIEHMIYSWGFGQYKDFVFLKYDFINFSEDTLWNCWHAPIMDVDVARAPFTAFGARNDRVRWYDCDSSLNMAVQWSDPDNGEQGFGFGYLGFDYLESPSVKRYFWLEEDLNGTIDTIFANPDILRIQNPGDETEFPFLIDMEGDTLFPAPDIFDDTNFLRKTQRVFPVEEQLGLVTFRNWSIENDVIEDEARYDFMASGEPDGDTGPGDKRYMMATGPYNMLPKDTARVVVAVILARAVGPEPNGECEDMLELESLDKFAQEVYDKNFRSPIPPNRPFIEGWTPLNNGMIIRWDNSAELSLDVDGDGLDFLGYKIYRARRPELDTFSLEPLPPSPEYGGGTGPLGWKEVASYEIPTAFEKSIFRSGGRGEDEIYYPLMDSLRIVGPIPNLGTDEPEEEFDQMAIRVMRIPRGAKLYTPEDAIQLTQTAQFSETVRAKAIPIIAAIDTFQTGMNDWQKFFLDYAGGGEGFNSPVTLQDANGDPIPAMVYDPVNGSNRLLDSIAVGIAYLNRSITPYNPLLYKNKSIEFDRNYRDRIDSLFENGNTFGDIISLRRTKISKSISDSLDETGQPVLVESAFTFRLYYPDEINPRDSIIINYEVNDTLKVTAIEEVETTTVDTAFYYNTLKEINANLYVIDIAVKRDNDEILEDPEHAQLVLDSLIRWTQLQRVRFEFPTIISDSTAILNADGDPLRDENGDIIYNITRTPFEETEMVREGVFGPYFDRVTNGRTFMDLGDDNDDNIITFAEDPTQTEKLINNIPYYYRVIPFDEGDWVNDIAQQSNISPFTNNFQAITNIAETYPEAPPAGKLSNLTILDDIDSTLMGGIYNLNFFAVDDDRLQQRFAGDTLELSFEPVWQPGFFIDQGQDDDDVEVEYSLIQRIMTLRNLSDNNRLLFESRTAFEPVPCNFGLRRQLTENAASYVFLSPNDDIILDTILIDGVETVREVNLHKSNSTQFDRRAGNFTSGRLDRNWCYTSGFTDDAFGTIGFEFDFIVEQQGGWYRGHNVEKIGQAEVAGTNVNPITIDAIMRAADPYRFHTNTTSGFDTVGLSSVVAGNPISVFDEDGNPQRTTPYIESLATNNTSFNNGPGTYILEFSEGGTETINLAWGSADPAVRANSAEFTVPYLNVTIRNVTEFKRFDEITGDSVLIPVPSNVEYMNLPSEPVPETISTSNDSSYYFYPHPRNLIYTETDASEFYGKYNMYAVAWPNIRNVGFGIFTYQTNFGYPDDGSDYATRNLQEYATYSGLQSESNQGRYYLTGTSSDGSVTVDFTNIVNISGAIFALDYANSGRAIPSVTNIKFQWDLDSSYTARDLATVPDFQPGDQLRLETFGSAKGLPWPGFSARVVVGEGSENQTSFSESELDEITIAPNPYYITHENQRSPYVTDLYFQRLPRKCTIEIYTQNGELIDTIEHDSFEDGGRKAVQIWDLMTKSGIRTQSQTLVALIKADGAEVAKTFSIVVGSYRVIE